MTGRLLAFALLACLCSGCTFRVSTEPEEQVTTHAGTPEQTALATRAAQDIVHAIDRREYAQVWEASSPILKDSSNRTVFIKMLEYSRGRLGKPDPGLSGGVEFSERIDASHPEGEYAVAFVHSSFGGKPLLEKVVMSREAGQWRLAGYFMQSKISADAQTPPRR